MRVQMTSTNDQGEIHTSYIFYYVWPQSWRSPPFQGLRLPRLQSQGPRAEGSDATPIRSMLRNKATILS